MKSNNYITGALTFIMFLSVVGMVFAQTNISSPSSDLSVTPKKTVEDQEIQSLKDKTATLVAELRKKNTKVVSGFVQSKKDKIIQIMTPNETVMDVKFDPELITFYQIAGNVKKEVKEDAVKKDVYLFVTGVVSEKTIEANAIYLDEAYVVGSGQVVEVNKEDFSIKVATAQKENYTFDIESFTRQQIMNIKTFELEKIGFSKIKEGDAVHFVFKRTGSERDFSRFPAQKILIVPQEYFIK